MNTCGSCAWNSMGSCWLLSQGAPPKSSRQCTQSQPRRRFSVLPPTLHVYVAFPSSDFSVVMQRTLLFCCRQRSNQTMTPPQSTDAMTYINNTLDHAIGQLCSSKYFDSRINIPDASAKKLPSLARRLYRIFGHACVSGHNLLVRRVRLTYIPPQVFSTPRSL